MLKTQLTLTSLPSLHDLPLLLQHLFCILCGSVLFDNVDQSLSLSLSQKKAKIDPDTERKKKKKEIYS